MIQIAPLGGANAVSPVGIVIVGRSNSQAYRWTEANGAVGIGDLPGGSFFSVAYDVSRDGSVVIGQGTSASGSEAFRWTAQGGMLGLGDLPGGPFFSEGRGTTADGSIVVGFSDSANGREAFRWTAETGMVGLGDLPGGGFYSNAVDVSADGSIIVGIGFSDFGGEAYVWDGVHGMRSLRTLLELDLSDWEGLRPQGISDDGTTIIGWGNHADLQSSEAWIAVLPPRAHLLGASSWRTHGGGVGRDPIEINPSGQIAAGNVSSEPRAGGIAELRLAFDRPPGPPGSPPVSIEQRTCGDGGAYVPYSGASTVSASLEGTELVLMFTPALENARTYRITVGPPLTFMEGQSIEVRGLVGDIDSSGSVNGLDRSRVIGVWTGSSGYSAATDVDLSGHTDSLDRSVVVAAWTGAQNCAP